MPTPSLMAPPDAGDIMRREPAALLASFRARNTPRRGPKPMRFAAPPLHPSQHQRSGLAPQIRGNTCALKSNASLKRSSSQSAAEEASLTSMHPRRASAELTSSLKTPISGRPRSPEADAGANLAEDSLSGIGKVEPRARGQYRVIELAEAENG